MSVDMSDANDDLDAFARLFGARPETPAEGLLPVTAAGAPAVAPAAAGSPGDALGWLLSDGPATATALAEPPQTLPTRRSIAAEAARASRASRRRNLIILGSMGGGVLILVGTMIVGGILPTAAWAALGGLMSDMFVGRFRFTALSFAYSIAAVISGFVPLLTAALGGATDFAWWHPGIVLAALSAITAVAAFAARRRVEPVDAI